MQSTQVHAGQSLRSTQQCLDAHPDVFQSVNATQARRELDAAITQLDAAAVEQGIQARESRGEVNRRTQLEHVLVRKYMTPLAKFARSQLKGVPNLDALTPSANQLKRERLAKAGLEMAGAAAPFAEMLVKANFPADFLTQLEAAAHAVHQSFDTRKGKQTARTGATKSIATLVRQGRTAVAALDSLVSHLILGNDRLEREWRSAKRVRKEAKLPVFATPPFVPVVTPPVPAPVPPSAAGVRITSTTPAVQAKEVSGAAA